MTQIRPQLFPQTPQGSAQGSAADAAKLAQVRALFSQAMGQAGPTAAAAPPQATTISVSAAPIQMAAPAQDGLQKIPRPGSLIDIRV